jgi:hypothetical protein
MEKQSTYSFETMDREVFTSLKFVASTVVFTEEVCPNEADTIYTGTLRLRIPMTLHDINNLSPHSITFSPYTDIASVSTQPHFTLQTSSCVFLRCPRKIYPDFTPVMKKDAFNKKKLRYPQHKVPINKLADHLPTIDLESDTELHNLTQTTNTAKDDSPEPDAGLEDLEDLPDVQIIDSTEEDIDWYAVLPEHDAQKDSLRII